MISKIVNQLNGKEERKSNLNRELLLYFFLSDIWRIFLPVNGRHTAGDNVGGTTSPSKRDLNSEVENYVTKFNCIASLFQIFPINVK